MRKASGTFWRILFALLLASALGAGPAFSGEFKSYKKPDPQRFAQGVAAYDVHNYAQAFNIWLPLAVHGDLAAVFNIGLMLRDGRGVPQDSPRALTFFRQGAERNHLGCQVNLADMYYRGVGTNQDFRRAAGWLMIAARRGHYPSMYKLAGMFERGEGIDVNLAAARELYLAAYEGGYQLAGNRLSELAAKSNAPPGLSSPKSAVPGQSDASAAPTSLAGAPALSSAPALAISSLALRGTLGMDDAELGDSPEASWNLRTSFPGADRLQTGEIAKDEASVAPVPRPRPRICANAPKAFDAHPSMCRMPPVRN